MTELSTLTTQRNEILDKIREIEETCEGIENKNNAKRVQTLNLEQTQLIAQRQELSTKLSALNERLSALDREIAMLSGTGVDRILEAIKEQRWYFFKNKPKILMDRNTGLLWPNLEYFSVHKEDGSIFSSEEAKQMVTNINLDGFIGWKIVTKIEFEKISYNGTTFPYYTGGERQIYGYNAILMDRNNNGTVASYWTDSDYRYGKRGGSPIFLVYNNSLVLSSDYEGNVSPNNPVYTEKERLQFTLDLFVKNGFWPTFKDDEITQLYKKIYFEKPALLKQLQELQTQIEKLQTITLLSSEFDYTTLLAKYDIEAIDASVIKYYQAVQQWTDELMEKLDYYEKEKENTICDFNLISLKLSRKYEQNPNLTSEENELLESRQKYFCSRFSLGMNSIKAKILTVKKQADDLEYQIDEIDNGENAIHELAVLEKEERASFALIAENTAKIIRNALKKIEYFEANHQFVISAIEIWDKWSDDYRVFKTTYREDLKNSCEEDGIEKETWQKWYEDWQTVRFAIESKVQPMIECGLKSDVFAEAKTEKSIVELVIAVLDDYKKDVDKFFLEERKGIYQKFAFQAGGDLQEKFEVESGLYKCVFRFQTALQEIIFSCQKAEDRLFILNWANSLLDIQIDEILAFVADNDLQKISQTVLEEFAKLKQKNYDIYLADAKAYGQAQTEREKQYNSLIFRMRRDLMK